jgi:alpha-glucosidase
VHIPWWRQAVVYQIYPRSFADGDGDGVGDLHGLRERLDHLVWLGVDAVWLSPIYRSPMADFGYDVADYTDVDPLFGGLDAFDALLAAAHGRGLKLLLDWVPNHTSDRHPWFVESRSSRASPKRNWYIWRDGAPDRPPNNWRAAWDVGPAWTWDAPTRAWYLHLFLPQQPDLNWAEPAVEQAMHDTLCFWLDKGVDGFRADVVHLIGKDPALPDLDPPDLDLVAHHDVPRTHELLRRIRAVLDAYPGDRMMVGEVNLVDSARVATYLGQGDELNLAFDFTPLRLPWDAAAWRARLAAVAEQYGGQHAWATWVLSNHDVSRHRTRLGGSEERARAAAVLLLTVRGTPFLYAGEELGLEDAVIPPDRVVDPGGRDPCRAPLPWDGTERHGWGPDPWLPFPPEAERRTPEALRAEPDSILQLYRRALGERRASAALRGGRLALRGAPEGVLAYERSAAGDRRRVLINFSGQAARVDRGGVVALATHVEREGAAFDGVLRPDEAVVLRP